MSDHDLLWTATPRLRRLLSVGLLALVLALVTGRAHLLVLGAPALLLVVVQVRGPRPTSVRVESRVGPDRCVEGDAVEVRVEVHTDVPAGQLDLRVAPAAALRGTAPLTGGTAFDTDTLRGRRWLQALRWGAWTAATGTIVVQDGSRLWQARVRCALAPVVVYPQPAALQRVDCPPDLLARIGTHVDRYTGSGVEFAGVRAYVPGDRPRDIHWPSSLRWGTLQVVEHAAERSADVVVGVDAFSDVAGSLARAVRGAAGVASGYSRAGDRVGLIVLGGGLRYVTPRTGRPVLLTIIEALLAVRLDNSVVTAHLDRAPRTALPPHAVMVLFTPCSTHASC